MYPRVKDVKPQDDYQILLTFDMKPYINKGFFKQLQDKNYFNTVKPFMDSIQWKNGQDLCPDTLYLGSQSLTSQRN
jgi:hypothetical protein